MKKILLLIIIGFAFFWYNGLEAKAGPKQKNYIVNDISISGLDEIPERTISNYLPIRKNRRVSIQEIDDSVKALYETDFFSKVSIRKNKKNLEVNVTRRPLINKVIFNSEIKSISLKDLKKILNELNLRSGRRFNEKAVNDFKLLLSRVFLSQGRFSSKIEARIDEKNNKVDILFDVDEGKISRLIDVKIIGSNEYKEKDLIKKCVNIKPRRILYWLNLTTNIGSLEERLDADLGLLMSFYMDNGFARFQVVSKKILLSKDRSEVNIVINLKEGEKYILSGKKVSGDFSETVSFSKELSNLIKGNLFSRKEAINASSAIAEKFCDMGYGAAKIEIVPEINDIENTIFLKYLITSGDKLYIKSLKFYGNYKTNVL